MSAPLSTRCFLGVLLAWALACSSAPAPACRVGADCASGACRSDGTCAPVSPGDAGPTGADGGPGNDAGGGADAGPGADGGPPGTDGGWCVPAHDGTIPRSRTPLMAGLRATFAVAEDAGFDTAGTNAADGGRRWDLTGPFSNDHTVVVQTQAPGGFWFANDFPNATYVAPLSDTSDLLGIFQATSTQLLLLGVASPTNQFPQTEVTYTPPAAVLSFPLQANASWSSQSTVTGTYLGVYGVYTESYTSLVDASGALSTPYADFEVLRVRTTLTRTVGVLVTVTRSFAFAADCFGPVATVTSQPDEPNTEFTSASELRRLAP